MNKKQELLQRLLKRNLTQGEITRLKYMSEQELQNELIKINHLRREFFE